jgi:hypothetical protein
MLSQSVTEKSPEESMSYKDIGRRFATISNKQLKKLFTHFSIDMLVIILISQLIIPPRIALADEKSDRAPAENSSPSLGGGMPDVGFRATADDLGLTGNPSSPSDPASGAPFTPGDETLFREVANGFVYGVKLDYQADQVLRFDKKPDGTFEQEFPAHNGSFNRPPIKISNFHQQVDVVVVPAAESLSGKQELQLRFGNRKDDGTFVEQHQHAYVGTEIIGTPYVGNFFIRFMDARNGVADAMRMISVESLVGNSQDKGTAFYAPEQAAMSLPLSLIPEGYKIVGHEILAPSRAPRALVDRNFDPVTPTAVGESGDSEIKVQNLKTGEIVNVWIPQVDLIEGWGNRKQQFAWLALTMVGTNEADMAMAQAFLDSMAKNQQAVDDIKKEEAEFLRERAENGVQSDLVRALILGTPLRPLLRTVAPNRSETITNELGEREQRLFSRIDDIAGRQRQTFYLDATPGADWDRLHQQIREAVTEDPNEVISNNTHVWARTLFAKERRLRQEAAIVTAMARSRARGLAKKFVTKVFTRSRAILLGVAFSVTGAGAGFGLAASNLDSAPSQYLINVGTRLIDASEHTPAEKLTEGIANFGRYTSENYYGARTPPIYRNEESLKKDAEDKMPRTMRNLWLLLGGTAFMTTSYWLVHAMAWGYSLARGQKVRPSDVMQNTANKMLLISVGTARAFQERLRWSLGLWNVYRYRFNTGNNSNYPYIRPFASQERIDQQTRDVDAKLADQAALPAMITDLYALALAAEEKGIALEDLLGAVNRGEFSLPDYMNSVMLNPLKGPQALVVRSHLIKTLEGLLDSEVPGTIRSAVLQQKYESYLIHADNIWAEAKKIKGATEELKERRHSFLRATSEYALSFGRSVANNLGSSVAATGRFARDNLALGMSGSQFANQYQGRPVSRWAVRRMVSVALPDAMLSAVLGGASEPDIFTMATSWQELATKGSYWINYTDQGIQWNMGTLPETLAQESAVGTVNEDAPFFSLAHDPEVGGYVQTQTVWQTLKALASGAVSTDGQGFFNTWFIYMRSVISNWQPRILLLSPAITAGILISGRYNTSPALVPLLAILSAVYANSTKIAVKFPGLLHGNLDPKGPEGFSLGYADIWPAVDTAKNYSEKSVRSNRQRIQEAAGLLGSRRLDDVKRGAYKMKLLYAEGQGWWNGGLPEHLNIASADYTFELGTELAEYSKIASPLPTVANALLDFLYNLSGAIFSTLFYFTMFAGILSAFTTVSTSAANALVALAWFFPVMGSVWGISKLTPVFNKKVTQPLIQRAQKYIIQPTNECALEMARASLPNFAQPRPRVNIQ